MYRTSILFSRPKRANGTTSASVTPFSATALILIVESESPGRFDAVDHLIEIVPPRDALRTSPDRAYRGER